MTTLGNLAFRHLQMCLKVGGKQRPSSREERIGPPGDPASLLVNPHLGGPLGSACRHRCVGSKVNVAFWDRHVSFSARNASSLRQNKAPAYDVRGTWLHCHSGALHPGAEYARLGRADR